jgi:mRNA-degrading endonuclease toxin of MazEF toxin-antitoxin module
MPPDSAALSLPEASCFGTLEALAWISSQVDSRDYEILLQISGSRPLVSCTSGILNEQTEAIPRMILQSKLAEDREYRIHELCALLTNALLDIL